MKLPKVAFIELGVEAAKGSVVIRETIAFYLTERGLLYLGYADTELFEGEKKRQLLLRRHGNMPFVKKLSRKDCCLF